MRGLFLETWPLSHHTAGKGLVYTGTQRKVKEKMYESPPMCREGGYRQVQLHRLKGRLKIKLKQDGTFRFSGFIDTKSN